jgi:mannose-1-phosphate guanylyltransferase
MNTGHKGRSVDRTEKEMPVALLLAGGDGKRLNEFTRQITGTSIPKQYCRLLGNSSLLEATLCRTELFTLKRKTHIVINLDHVPLAREQLLDLPDANIFVQPENRDTGPGLIFALLRLQQLYRDPTIAVFPTDHFIDNSKAFMAHATRAARLVECMPDRIAVLGIVPDRPETGYGYLIPGDPIDKNGGAFHVRSFCEKPCLSAAMKVMSLGGLWNTFVMAFKLSAMLQIFEQIVPDKFHAMAVEGQSPHRMFRAYRKLDPWSFSAEVLTRIPERMVMLKIEDVYWSDWGTPELIDHTYRKWSSRHLHASPMHQLTVSQREIFERIGKSRASA